MRARPVVLACALVLLFLGMTFRLASAGPALQPGSPIPYIYAESWETEVFKTNNGISPTYEYEIPHLILYRDGALTDPPERTLVVGVNNALVYAPGGIVTATVTVVTQHRDPDQGGDVPPPGSPVPIAPRFTVWQETKVLTKYTDPFSYTVVNVEFRREFTQTVTIISGTTPVVIPTPTDYYRVDLSINGSSFFARDYAFLMENQISAPLDAQNELLVRYYDMAPMGHKDNWGGAPGTNWLPRKDVRPYVENQLVQIIKDAFDAMVNEWGFGPPHPRWRDWASGWADGRPNVLTVDISHPDTWFHTKGGVHHAIHLQPYAGVEDGYDDVSQWYKSILARFTSESKHLSETFLWLVEVLIERTRHLVYEQARAMTWFYFWRAGMADLECEGAGLAQCAGVTPEDVYQEALKDTKSFMATVVWPEFKTWLTEETDLFILVPPEEVR